MTTTTSPAPTVSPSATFTSVTVPDRSAVMLFSIFIASSTHTASPGFDGVAHRDEHLHDRALHRARSPDRFRLPPARGRGRSACRPRARCVGRRRRACGLGHPHPHREPLAVDLDVDIATHARRRRRVGLALAAGAAMPVRSRRSSTHLVEWAASMKSGCSRIATSAGMVVATPSTLISPSARSIRRRAVSRSAPQVTSLPTRLS